MPEAEISHRRVLAIAPPILLANITVPLPGLADTAVIGQLGRADLIGAVAIGAVILEQFIPRQNQCSLSDRPGPVG